MTGWQTGIMAAFDLETTSADPESARIVTACLAHVDGSGTVPPESQVWLSDVDGAEIPADAVKVHGITTERARAEGAALREVTAELASAILRDVYAGIPVVAFNAAYDLTVLDRETRRFGLESFGDRFQAAKGSVIDPHVLDKLLDTYRKGSRTLTAVCGHYRVRLDGAHDAASDAIAAARVAWAIARDYPHIGAMTLGELHNRQVRARAEQARSLEKHLRSLGNLEPVDGSWPLHAWTEAA
jgi:DNA polymerase III epsilon subunit-like protein